MIVVIVILLIVLVGGAVGSAVGYNIWKSKQAPVEPTPTATIYYPSFPVYSPPPDQQPVQSPTPIYSPLPTQQPVQSPTQQPVQSPTQQPVQSTTPAVLIPPTTPIKPAVLPPAIKTKEIEFCSPYGLETCTFTGDTFTCDDYWKCKDKLAAKIPGRVPCSTSPDYIRCTAPAVKTKDVEFCSPYGVEKCEYTGATFTCDDYWKCKDKLAAKTPGRVPCSTSPDYINCSAPVVKTKDVEFCNPYGIEKCEYTGTTFTCDDYNKCVSAVRVKISGRAGCSSSPDHIRCVGE